MPIIRKIIDAGKTSRAVILPKTWLEYFERKTGKPIKYVAMEVNSVLKIEPIFNEVVERKGNEGFDALAETVATKPKPCPSPL